MIFSNEAKLAGILIMIKSNTVILKTNHINKLLRISKTDRSAQNSKHYSESLQCSICKNVGENANTKLQPTPHPAKFRILFKLFRVDVTNVSNFKFLQISFELLQKHHIA